MLKSCKKKCCVCYDPVLDKLIYESKEKLEKLSQERIKTLYYGYSCDKKAEETIVILNNYIHVLEDENRKILLGGKECLDCNNLQKLAEKVRKITVSCDIEGRRDLIIDKSKLDIWLTNHPGCVAYEEWEKFAYRLCGLLSLDIQIQKVDCDLDLEIFSSEQVCNLVFDITRQQIPCDLMIAISVYKQACDLDFKITRTEQECKLDFNLLKSEVNCNLDFKTYKKLIDCNLSYDIIRTTYDNGCSFAIGDEVELVTPLNTYNIKGFNFKDIPNISVLEKLGIDTSKSKYKKNPTEFIKKLKSDYRVKKK